MSNRLHLHKIALTAALIAATATPVFGQMSAPTQPLPSVSAVPAAPGRYDFQWEIYTARAASGGKAIYVFEGPAPVGIAVLGADGNPQIFPIVSGVAAEALEASFQRYRKANGIGATQLSKTPVASLVMSPSPTAKRSDALLVAFNTNGIHVSLNDGTRVDFLAATIEVTMPAATTSLSATTIGFNLRMAGGVMDPDAGEIALTMNGQLKRWQQRGPVWEGIKDLFLAPALYKVAQAAHIAGKAPGRPADAPDHAVLVAKIERAFGIVPISFF